MTELALTPLLIALELGFLAAATARARRIGMPAEEARAVFALLAWIAAYALLTSWLGARGVFVSDRLLRWLPGFWLQLVTVAVCVGPVLGSGMLREGLRGLVDRTPWSGWAGFHGLRLTALGTLLGAAAGTFPVYFAVAVGVPDLLFGASALWVAWRAHRGRLGRRRFLAWNVLGALVIVPAAPVLLQLGLPGPFHVFEASPDARAVFTYPMSIAPMIGVPLFVLVHACVAWRLLERGRSGSPGSHHPRAPVAAR